MSFQQSQNWQINVATESPSPQKGTFTFTGDFPGDELLSILGDFLGEAVVVRREVATGDTEGIRGELVAISSVGLSVVVVGGRES